MTQTVLMIILILLLAISATVTLWQWRSIVHLKHRYQGLSDQLKGLEQERPALMQLVQTPRDDETQQLIKQRYDLVSELLAATVSGDTERSNAVLDGVEELVSDPAVFMRQLRLIYTRLQPAMMSHLQSCGLTEREEDICCLYALGLNGKAIQHYTHNGRHFQHVGEIRKKLGLGEHDKNIDGYIRDLLR